MGRVERFEDLIAWQKARHLTRGVYRVTTTSRFAQDRALAVQMQRAAVSVMSNIAEGFERGRMTEFHYFLCVAKGSCAELRSQLYVALDARHIDEAAFQQLLALIEEEAKIIGGLRSSVQRQRTSGKGEGNRVPTNEPETNLAADEALGPRCSDHSELRT